MAFNRVKEGVLVERLRKISCFVSKLSLFAEYENRVIGHILFYPIKITACIHEWLVGGFRMNVLKSGEGKKLNVFKEIKSEIIFSGERIMFLLVDLKAEQIVPEHRHLHEQMGICLKGKAEFISAENKFLVEAGTFYWMKPNELHSIKVLEESVFLDVFSPPREDYLEKASL